MRVLFFLSFLLVPVVGCGDGSAKPGDQDMAVHVVDAAVDFATSPGDLGMCSNTDPGGDGQSCGAGCPAGTTAVNQPSGGCTCLYKCDPATPTQCSCNRRCISLTRPDAGVVGGACFLGSGPAQKCGSNGAGCAQALFCAGPTDTTSYCLYECQDQSGCPAQTQCAPVYNSMMVQVGLTCQFISGSAGLDPGATCDRITQNCKLGFICDGTCKPQCDGPGGTCTSGGTCTAVVDASKGNRISAYVCK
jgi:hypothetical protein